MRKRKNLSTIFQKTRIRWAMTRAILFASRKRSLNSTKKRSFWTKLASTSSTRATHTITRKPENDFRIESQLSVPVKKRELKLTNLSQRCGNSKKIVRKKTKWFSSFWKSFKRKSNKMCRSLNKKYTCRFRSRRLHRSLSRPKNVYHSRTNLALTFQTLIRWISLPRATWSVRDWTQMILLVRKISSTNAPTAVPEPWRKFFWIKGRISKSTRQTFTRIRTKMISSPPVEAALSWIRTK